MLSTSDVCKRFGVSMRTVQVWHGRGLLPAQKVGGIWLFDEADVNNFVRPVNGRPRKQEEAEMKNITVFARYETEPGEKREGWFPLAELVAEMQAEEADIQHKEKTTSSREPVDGYRLCDVMPDAW